MASSSSLFILIITFVIIMMIGDAAGCGCSQHGAKKERNNNINNNNLFDHDDHHHHDHDHEEMESLSSSSSSKMVKIPAGTFRMGTDDGKGYPADGEGPSRKVTLKEFWMDQTEVSNKDFFKFINATNYRTEAEGFGWSFVFFHFVHPEEQEKITKAVKGAEWWLPVNGAVWNHPEGPGSDLNTPFPSPDKMELPASTPFDGRMSIYKNRWDLPVVHVSWNDAVAYCSWANKRLPSEAEWEYTARGGLKRKEYGWGNEMLPNKTHMMNVWQGDFPNTNLLEDSHYGPAPVYSFPPNGYKLYNMEGNVWEWTQDWFTNKHTNNNNNKEGLINPTGPESGTHRVMRGGSFLCHASYCFRYRTTSRSQNTPDSSTYNLGFRCASSVAPINN